MHSLGAALQRCAGSTCAGEGSAGGWSLHVPPLCCSRQSRAGSQLTSRTACVPVAGHIPPKAQHRCAEQVKLSSSCWGLPHPSTRSSWQQLSEPSHRSPWTKALGLKPTANCDPGLVWARQVLEIHGEELLGLARGRKDHESRELCKLSPLHRDLSRSFIVINSQKGLGWERPLKTFQSDLSQWPQPSATGAGCSEPQTT